MSCWTNKSLNIISKTKTKKILSVFPNKVIALASVVILRSPPKHNVSLRKEEIHQPWTTVSIRIIPPTAVTSPQLPMACHKYGLFLTHFIVQCRLGGSLLSIAQGHRLSPFCGPDMV